MTTEQREAIERLKDDIKHAELRDAVDDDCTVCFTEDVDTVLSLVKEQVKQIDLMANCILVREIGKKPCQFNENCTKYEKGRDIHCKDCIKQYFANKVNSSEQK